jgi:hypothetical protein
MHDLVVVENVQDTIIIIHFVRHGLTGWHGSIYQCNIKPFSNWGILLIQIKL